MYLDSDIMDSNEIMHIKIPNAINNAHKWLCRREGKTESTTAPHCTSKNRTCSCSAHAVPATARPGCLALAEEALLRATEPEPSLPAEPMPPQSARTDEPSQRMCPACAPRTRTETRSSEPTASAPTSRHHSNAHRCPLPR